MDGWMDGWMDSLEREEKEGGECMVRTVTVLITRNRRSEGGGRT
jgi:hypothetical protein